MTIQDKLFEYENRIEEITGWTKTHWPDFTAAPQGMKVLRLVKDMGNNDRFMLHRFEADEGAGYSHGHEYALGVHALGPAPYEVGFVVNGSCQTRTYCEGPFYYEMRTPQVHHFVLPKSTPLYTVAIWTPFDREVRREIPPHVDPKKLRDHTEILKIVKKAFKEHYGLDDG